MLGRLSPPPEYLPAWEGRQGALSGLSWGVHGAAPGPEEMNLGLAEDWGLSPAPALPLTGAMALLEA